ncbi:RNA polymerase sigma factor [Pelagicoccus mobilis]|uniref:RNA polymerase sigma factor n=1 Tax=Pelagicoccus mobilis TaxID=415221 RepID=A0A934RXQ9_9BACT|nr:RNA polymerase sigma factor [Pelagicoccus mobilis]MBK1878702.1 RNA polymerase sigma factor [Pelagicoccus mobilis]
MPNCDPLLPSDEALLDRCQKGDDRSFRALVDRHHGALFATAMGMLGSEADAESVVQDGFLRFYRNLDRFEGRSSLKTYLTRIVMNQALKQLQQRRRWYHRFLSSDDEETNLPEASAEPEVRQIETEELAAGVREAVQTLKPEFRSVVVLRFLNGCSTQECADILGVPPGTVMSRLSRALDKLAPLLKELNSQNVC